MYFDIASENHSDYMKMVSLLKEVTEEGQKHLMETFNYNKDITLLAKKQNNKWGLINKSNEFIIQPKYDLGSNMISERAIVK
ncbi:MAG: hypothetical protein ACI87N_000571 [Flavobacteriales bacterium]|jgi:hypothetical protein